MTRSLRARFVQSTLLAALVALLVAGCGGGDSGGGGGDAAQLAPPRAPLFIGFVVRPEGELKTNIEGLAQSIGGVDLGELIVSELERSASGEGESIDFEKEVEPWLGERGGFFAEDFAGENFNGYGLAIETSDEGAAREFVEERGEAESESPKAGSYEGVDFQVSAADGNTVGVFDGFLVLAEDEATFKQMVDASEGESLAGEDAYAGATANLPGGSAADVYVDIGRLIGEGPGIDPETKLFLDAAGTEPRQATAVASVIPGSDQIEIDVRTDLNGDQPPAGDASKLLEALPGDSVVALAAPEFGKRFEEGIDRIDANGIPGQVPPHELKRGLKQAGVDIESIAGSIGDVGLFVTGSNEANLSGAMVLEAEGSKQATNTVSNLGLLLRASGTPGVTALNGEASGFSVRSPELGGQPIVVVAKGSRIAVGYGLAAATAVLGEGKETLADSPSYEEAVDALGGTPISGFADGPAALRLASSLVPSDDEGFREAKRYLTKVDYLALGSEVSEGLTVAKLIVGVGR
jgi:hypothetical protein